MAQQNNFYERLQFLIDSIGWKQETLALKIGRTVGTVSRWINTRSSKIPSKTSLNAICMATGCNLQWLREGKGPMFQDGKEPGQVPISGISYREQSTHPAGSSTEPDQTGTYAAQDFRRTCIGMLEPIIEYIAESYGTRPSDIERFKADFVEKMPEYRLWLYGEAGKKRAGGCDKDGPSK